jgi:5-methylcytosine-specific restriction endonuclease McrA
VERIVRGWRRVDRQAEARESGRQDAGRALYARRDEDGTVLLRARLTPEVGAVVLRALAAARAALYPRPPGFGPLPSDPALRPPTAEQQEADALALLAETALHHALDPGAPGERYQVVVHVDAAALAEPDQPHRSVLPNGARVSAGTCLGDADQPGQSVREDSGHVSAGTCPRDADQLGQSVLEDSERVSAGTCLPDVNRPGRSGREDSDRVSAGTWLGDADQPGQSVLEDGGPASAGTRLADPDQPGQSVLEDGTRVSAETARRLACDASRVVMRHDGDGRVVEVGARTRTIPPALRRVLQHRDRACRFPGCGRAYGQGHHIRHWARGGPTTLSNLVLLCRRHHRAVHEEGYGLARLADGVLEFRRPDGRVLPDVPPLAEIPQDPVETLRARHEAQGLRLNARTTCAGWRGERLDVGYAIDVLHPLAVGHRMGD